MDYVGENAIIGTVLAGAAGLAVGGTVGYIAGKSSSSKSSRKRKKSKNSTRKKRTSTSKSRGRKLKFGSPAYRKRYLKGSRKQKQPYTAGRRKDTSHRRIKYTKNNQPYIILPSGKARFISKKTVRISKKRQGGKY